MRTHRHPLRRHLLQLACLAAVLAAPAASRAQTIAVYGAQNGGGLGSTLRMYDQAGNTLHDMPFQDGVGAVTWGPSANIEDIAFDASGNLYAMGAAGTSRAIFRNELIYSAMNVMFPTIQAYDASVDGSIAISPTGTIAIYGSYSTGSSGTSVRLYNQAGSQLNELLFQTAVGSGSFTINPNIEDIAWDSAGNLYAVGKPNSSTARTIYKWTPGQIAMYVLFQKESAYDAGVDGSIAIAPTGEIAVYGAASVSTFGSSVRIYDQTGKTLHEMLFQTSVGGGGYGVSTSIEDIAFDKAGELYAVGKPNASALRSIYKSSIGFQFMTILFQKDGTYDTGVDGSIAIAPNGPWTTLGSSLKGAFSLAPRLQCSGPLGAGSSNQLSLTFAKPSTIATLVVGLSAVNVPFKGGVFVPDATVTLPVATNTGGAVALPFVFPAGVPSGTALYVQFWIPDAGGVEGFSASNAMQGVTP